MMAVTIDTEFGKTDLTWWRRDLTDVDRHQKMQSAVRKIQQTQLWRKQANLQHLRLYGNAPILGFGIANYTKPAQLSGGKVGLNIIRSCSDALTAKLCSDEMKARILTNGGDWDMQQRARELEKFLDGQAHETEVHEKWEWMVLQACIYGTGVLKPYIFGRGKDMHIEVDTTPTWSVMVDDQESLYGRPPNFYQRTWYDRNQLRAMFDGNTRAQQLIDRAKLETDKDLDSAAYSATSDQVLVTEAWHLPTRKGVSEKTTDGTHAINIENGLLYSAPYIYPEPPFVFYSLWPQPLGFFGVGIAQQLQGLQIELNVLMQKIQRSFHLLGSGHVLLDKGSKMNKHKVDNDVGSIWEYMGIKPEIVATNPVAPQIFEHMDRIYARAFEISGISQLEASSLKPKGLNSGKAIDSYLDITTERFNVCLRRSQRAFIRLNKWLMRLATEISETNPDFGTLTPDKSCAHIVHFKKNELEEDKYVMRIYATNMLSDEPSERLEQVERLSNAGRIDASTSNRLLDLPDLEEYSSLEQSAYDCVEQAISAALKDGKYIGPESYLPIGTPDQPGPAIKQVQNALIRAKVRGCPEAKLKLLKQWIADATAMMPSPPPMPAPQVPPNGIAQPNYPAGPGPELASGGALGIPAPSQ